jgi:SAM-dependent methyltransferase
LDLDDGSETYDAIVAWHLLEHETDPRRFLTAAFQLLRPGGILFLRVPNLGSTVSRLAGQSWQWLSPPEHVFMFTQKAISLLLETSQFEISQIRTARGNARNMWFEAARARAKSLASRFVRSSPPEGRFGSRTVYEGRPWYRAAERTIEALSKPIDSWLSPWLAKRGREAELILLARKPTSRKGRREADR